MARLDSLERQLGHRFRDAALLEQALTHGSFAAEHNERLEFLGDSVLGCAVAEALFARFPGQPEGKLTRMRASLVREESLAAAAARIGLADHLRLGKTEQRSGPRASTLADALEALIGAVFLDGGYEAARASVLALLAEELKAFDASQPAKDAKTRLQELLQAKRTQPPEYRIKATSGEAHRRSFEVECRVPSLNLEAVGSGSSRQRAEQQAAQAVLDLMGA